MVMSNEQVHLKLKVDTNTLKSDFLKGNTKNLSCG